MNHSSVGLKLLERPRHGIPAEPVKLLLLADGELVVIELNPFDAEILRLLIGEEQAKERSSAAAAAMAGIELIFPSSQGRGAHRSQTITDTTPMTMLPTRSALKCSGAIRLFPNSPVDRAVIDTLAQYVLGIN